MRQVVEASVFWGGDLFAVKYFELGERVLFEDVPRTDAVEVRTRVVEAAPRMPRNRLDFPLGALAITALFAHVMVVGSLDARNAASFDVTDATSELRVSTEAPIGLDTGDSTAHDDDDDAAFGFYTAAGGWRLFGARDGKLRRNVPSTLPTVREPSHLRFLEPRARHDHAWIIQRVIELNARRFRRCFDDGLRRDAHLAGSVVTKLVIARDGSVTAASDAGSHLRDASVVACVTRAFFALSFPEDIDGPVTQTIMMSP